MAATGYTPIQLYRTATAAAAPIAANLTSGELAINYNDGVLYYKDSAGVVQVLAKKSGITGSGTANYITKFTSSSNIGNSVIYDDGTNVGIGTSLPAAKLNVYSSTGTVADLSGSIRVENASGTAGTYAGILFKTYDTLNSFVTGIRTGSFGGLLSFGVNNGGNASSLVEAMRINSSANVGIGTSVADYRLDVYSPDYIVGKFTGGYVSGGKTFSSVFLGEAATNQGSQVGFAYNPTTPSSSFFHVTPYGGTEGSVFTIGVNGNVGIANGNPDAKLVVQTPNSTSIVNALVLRNDDPSNGTGTAIKFGYGSAESNLYGARIVAYGYPSSIRPYSLGFQRANDAGTGWNTSMTIDPNGKVAVGDAGGNSLYGALNVISSDSTHSVGSSTASLYLSNDYGGSFGYSSDLIYTIGVGATNKLAGISGIYTNYSTSVGGALAFYTNNGSSSFSERMRIDSSGNVGIGTASLPSKLTVAGSGNFNGIKIGCGPYDASSASDGNTVIGYQVFNGVTGGSGHTTAIGYKSCNGTNAPWRCVAIGSETLQDGGDYCTVIGQGALKAGFGNSDIAIGTDAMGLANSSYSGGSNTVIGVAAAAYIDSAVNNIVIGYNAGASTIVFGASNIILGNYAELSSNASNNQYVIGNNVTSAGGFSVTIGNASGKIYANYTSSAAWSFSSDERLKKNIQPDTLGLSFINKLNPVTYNWKANNELDQDNPEYKKENKKDTTAVLHGLLAQQVKAALDSENCSTFDGWGVREDGIQTVAMSAFVLPLINAVKELKSELDSVKAQLATLQGN